MSKIAGGFIPPDGNITCPDCGERGVHTCEVDKKPTSNFLQTEEALKIREDLGKFMGEVWKRECAIKRAILQVTNPICSDDHIQWYEPGTQPKLSYDFLFTVIEKLIEDKAIKWYDIGYRFNCLDHEKHYVNIGFAKNDKSKYIHATTLLESLAKAIHAAVKYIQEKN